MSKEMEKDIDRKSKHKVMSIIICRDLSFLETQFLYIKIKIKVI